MLVLKISNLDNAFAVLHMTFASAAIRFGASGRLGQPYRCKFKLPRFVLKCIQERGQIQSRQRTTEEPFDFVHRIVGTRNDLEPEHVRRLLGKPYFSREQEGELFYLRPMKISFNAAGTTFWVEGRFVKRDRDGWFHRTHY